MLKMSLWGKLHVSNLRFLSVQGLINVLSMINNLKKTMPYFLLFNRNMLWLGFVIAKERMAELRWRSNKHTQNKSSLCFCIYICICICLCTCICVCVCVCLLSFKQEAADLMEQ